MLSQKDKDRLKELGIDHDSLVTAITATEETAITLPVGSLYTDEQLTERDRNTDIAGVSKGEKNALALAKSEFKKRGLDLTGERWGDVVNEVNTLINKDKDAKLQQLQEQNTALLADVDTFKSKVAEAETRIGKVEFEHGIMSKLPANALGLSPKESLELMRMRGYVPERTETGTVWKKNGEIIKDNATHAPLTDDKAIPHIWGELKWTAGQNTGGGGRNITNTGAGGTGGYANISEATKAFQETNPGKNKMSPEYMSFVEKAAKENPAFSYEPVNE